MSISKTYSAQLIGLQTEIVNVEVDISNGLHSFSIVGLGDRAVGEAKDRISAAIKNSGYVSPKQKNQKVVISLAPADVRKEGPSFDLSMAMAYLIAANEISLDSEGMLFLGELSLKGEIRHISGLLPILCQATNKGFKEVFIPYENIQEASLARNIIIYPSKSLKEIVDHINKIKTIEPLKPAQELDTQTPTNYIDMNTIRGNENIKRGLEIAAAGAHNVIMCGPPGTGKTMLAQSFTSILPPLSYNDAVEVTGIHSAAKVLKQDLITLPPFRSPHHTASYPSIVGGGAFPRPGEITLAHKGVLFLDELPEFDRKVLEALRQPLEDRVITISRAKGVITFPAKCILIASMNPCPCGRGKDNKCTCPPHIVEIYQRKISGPILDRIDIWLNVNKIDYDKLSMKISSEESSEEIAKRIMKARIKQEKRFENNNTKGNIHDKSDIFSSKNCNGEMSAKDIEKIVKITEEGREILTRSAKKLELSGRAFHRIIKVAQTISDLADRDMIEKDHILEALQYRQRI